LIVNKATGKKFGKSEDGAVWLDPHKTSVYKFYQFWLNLDDEGVIDYMKVYTVLSKDEIESITSDQQRNPQARIAQKALAREVTTIVHGKDRYESVQRVTDVLFGDESIAALTPDDIEQLGAEIPTVASGQTVISALVAAAVVKSNGEARRLIAAGAIAKDGVKLTEDEHISSPSLLKKGKNDFILVR
jgi:tyrosyl-tRNA synthetase